MTRAVPTLETNRLILRQWRRDDFEPLAAFLADGEASRYRGSGKAATTSEAWRFLCEKIGEWHLRGTGEFAVETKATGDLVGWAGLWHPIELDEPELAWSLFQAAQGNGYATEAAERVMRWAADDLGLPPLFSFVHADNHPSRRLAERLGAMLTGETTLRGQPRLLYRHRDLNAETSTHTTSNKIRREPVCQS
jgi:RimJ/RimL family protein N-acetyltransferase